MRMSKERELALIEENLRIWQKTIKKLVKYNNIFRLV